MYQTCKIARTVSGGHYFKWHWKKCSKVSLSLQSNNVKSKQSLELECLKPHTFACLYPHY